LPSVNIEWAELSTFAKECWLYLADDEMEYLHSQGVVIKVKCGAGYAVSPLIKEVKQ